MVKLTKAEEGFGKPMRWDLGDNGGKVVFSTFPDALEWARQENAAWQDTFHALNQTTGRGELIKLLNVYLGTLLNPMLDLGHLDGSRSTKELRAEIDGTMKLFNDGRLLTQLHPRRQAMTKLLPDAPFIVLGQVSAILDADLYVFLSQIIQDRQSDFLAGFLTAQRPDTAAMDEANQLKEIIVTATNELGRAQENLEGTAKATIDLRAQIEEINTSKDAYFTDIKEQLEQLRASYVGERQLEEPSHHWNTQADIYKGRFEAAVGYLILVGAGVGIFLWLGAGDLLKALTEATGGKFQYSHVAILIILANGLYPARP